MAPSRPSSDDYLADSEGSNDSHNYEMETPHFKLPARNKSKKYRRVTVRTPSEEGASQQDQRFGRPRRSPAPYTSSRRRRRDNEESSKPSQPEDSGAQPNNPTVTTAPLGANPVYIHNTAVPHAYNSGQQPFVVSVQPNNTPYFQATNLGGQSAPLNPANRAINDRMDEYQNATPANNGINFQPQVPDTSLGPMIHQYVPRFDAGGAAYVVQPGIAPPGSAVPLQAGPTTAPIMHVVGQQPYHSQPMMIAGGPAGPGAGPPVMMAAGGMGGGVPPGQPVFVNGGPVPMMPGNFPGHAAYHHFNPATGVGQTAGEVAAMAMMDRELNEPQDFKPGDDNPSRMYQVRQLDGQWVPMPRATIDSFGKDGARWYVTDDGVFYAVRLDG
ncbi:hypothetical protein M406DRAFT_66389 [Cryphonectria parasitica EP155]|uniref:Uncharacterized protein n=1 Tax=Cryphonectria parasitica (strain ATCC 38755 / EP155) TaxID=660469 RepID=A0A9P4YBD2_CRYP1|nr:uncharacterized protein M406DRAFT_66389 [Cryphonectria parasitica EP155]KAF3769928.1 hypothetical protein M406DRAFT_66389 [Cryphonectria parasitica EP155]